ncbi:MAG: HAMP domain-containing sensor histidine kinase [Candidatus Nanohaloarchaea archaeon]|nr:HAMP domain-containing sensor histidine kinase [Candidatus Nanohaloarchaea archaeon]
MSMDDGVDILVVGASDSDELSAYLDGANVTFAGDPGEGLEALQAHEYDAVIDDYAATSDGRWDEFVGRAVEQTGGRYVSARDTGYETAVAQVDQLLGTVNEYEEQVEALEAELEESEDWRALINHDIKNIVNVVEGWKFLAREEGRYDEFVDKTENQMSRIVDILEREGTSRKMKGADTETYSTDYLFQTAIDDCAPQAEEKGIDIQYTPDEIYTVEGISYLPDAFKNILSNGVKHSEGDTIVLDATNGDMVEMTISDDGIGIPEDRRDDILEQGEGDGTGIGLYLDRRAAELSGGELAVGESDMGGARFTMRLPRAGD